MAKIFQFPIQYKKAISETNIKKRFSLLELTIIEAKKNNFHVPSHFQTLYHSSCLDNLMLEKLNYEVAKDTNNPEKQAKALMKHDALEETLNIYPSKYSDEERRSVYEKGYEIAQKKINNSFFDQRFDIIPLWEEAKSYAIKLGEEDAFKESQQIIYQALFNKYIRLNRPYIETVIKHNVQMYKDLVSFLRHIKNEYPLLPQSLKGL